MLIHVVGRGPIATEAIRQLVAAGHTINDADKTPAAVDLILWCRGNTWDWCVVNLRQMMYEYKHIPFVVVTSEHGSIPTIDRDYSGYHAVKAAQKMLCRCLVEQGGMCVDVSPAFVLDSSPDKRVNKDQYYRETVESACNSEFPVTCQDVGKVILFAVENCGKISGTVIKVSAGWTQGRI